ncbi:NELL2-interacting cell ontogeny regulator 1 isoform X1 [Rhineura floridana]|uniref:NELL2-interacting cell ontogeny regulator 1 isoform X1 n=1 Tax=Rhineura floridana TaxID=261503 RepID=UPI002AC87BAC|nr:NELL2-interacting cell ontogeny regulator 1 isoform X1 [Rhineura floridana]
MLSNTGIAISVPLVSSIPYVKHRSILRLPPHRHQQDLEETKTCRIRKISRGKSEKEAEASEVIQCELGKDKERQCTCSEVLSSSLLQPFKDIITKASERSVKKEDSTNEMLKACASKVVILVPLILVVGLISTKPATAEEESGTTIPAESRPCVDCHAFEFMQRALQDLKKTAYSLDSRTETLLFKVEKRTLCDCLTANALN